MQVWLAEIPHEYQLFVWVAIIGFLLGVIPTAKAVMDIVEKFRGSPPPDAKFATKEELKALEMRVTEKVADVRRELAAAEQRTISLSSDIRTELRDHKTDLRTMTRDVGTLTRLMGRLDGLIHSLQAEEAAVK